MGVYDLANWADSTLPITISGGQSSVSVSNPTDARFFRLSRVHAVGAEVLRRFASTSG